MKIIRLICALIFILTLTACSNTSKKGSATDELAGAANNTDFIVDSNADELDNMIADQAKAEEMPTGEALSPEQAMNQDVSEVTEGTIVADVGQYTVEQNDTLMFIAFKLYGDYGKWKELAGLNPNLNGKLKVGDILKYNIPVEKFNWMPKGNPYLIKQGDTLGLISKDVYGVVKRWKDVYENNRPMIKDPNLIFAGFTLYYIPDRDIASENY